MRVAAFDCGTNSLRLLVADVEDGAVTDVVRAMEIVRLGEGVDRTGRFADAALARTFAALDSFARVLREHGISAAGARPECAIRFVATSAARDAANRDEFLDGVRARLGIDAEIVTGAEEARLSFAGGTGDLRRVSAVTPPYLVCDIGGGSTEFVLGDADGVTAAVSVDVGCVRMTERRLADDPPTTTQIAAAIDDIDAAIDAAAAAVPLDRAGSLIGLAGSVTTVAALALGLPAYDADRIHHARISAADVASIAADLLAMPRAKRASLGPMHPGRVDVIGAGALILDRVVRRAGVAEVVVSEHDILDGIALSIAERASWS